MATTTTPDAGTTSTSSRWRWPQRARGIAGRPRRPPARGWRRFARHYGLMVVAMYAGMLLLDPVYAAIATRAGFADPWARLPVLSALVMSVDMTVPMVLLMLRQRHGVLLTVEMAASMLTPTLAAAGLHAWGALAADRVMTVAHVAMFPAMLLVMLRHHRHYAT